MLFIFDLDDTLLCADSEFHFTKYIVKQGMLDKDFYLKKIKAFDKDYRSGNLNFSWRIVMAPEPVLNYVVAHEVAHLEEHNHSEAFWALVEKLCLSRAKRKLGCAKMAQIFTVTGGQKNQYYLNTMFYNLMTHHNTTTRQYSE